MLNVVKKGSPAPASNVMPNPVANQWQIDLIFGKHKDFSVNTYGVKFTTKLEGQASKCFLVIDLREKFDEFLKELNVFGCLEREEFHRAIDYVKYLKMNGIFQRVPNLLAEIEGTASQDESLELYETVVEAVIQDPDAFPTISSDDYKHGVSSGVILDTAQYLEKYGENVVGITTEALMEILGLEGSTKGIRFTEITRGWREAGYLLKLSRQPRLQEPVKPNINSKEVRRFYIFKMHQLEGQ